VEGYNDGRAKHRLLKSLGRQDRLDPAMVDRLRAPLKRYGREEQLRALKADTLTTLA